MKKQIKHPYFSLITATSISLFTLTAASLPCKSSETYGKISQINTNSDLTVPAGTLLRKAILNALRQEMKHLHNLDMLFVVKHLKVKEGWAWVHALPQSPNGKEHYEDLSVLLHLKEGTWRVIELACTEEDNPQCLSNPAYFSELKKRFPKVPKEILPQE